MALSLLGYGYAATLTAGGVMGFVKAGSETSLATGLLFGGMSALGAHQIAQDPKNVSLLLGSSAVLTGVMGYRLMQSGKCMPDGFVGGLSVLIVIATGRVMLQK